MIISVFEVLGLEILPQLFSDAPYIVRGVSIYKDVCLSGHLNRFGQMNLCQNIIFIFLDIKCNTKSKTIWNVVS